MSAPLKAEFWFSRDYWLTEEEILQTEIVSWPSFMILGLAIGIILLPFTRMNVIASGAAGFVAAYAAVSVVARRRRRALGALALEEIPESKRLSARIPWSSVVELRISGRSLLFRTDDKRYHRGSIKSDLKEVRQLISSKIGDRLTVETRRWQ